MKKLIFSIFILFLVFGASRAQVSGGFNENDLEKLKAFMNQNAVDKDGKELLDVINAQILLGPNYFYSWGEVDEVWLKFLESRSFNENNNENNNVVVWTSDPENEHVRRLEKLNFSWILDKPNKNNAYLSGTLDFEDCKYLTHVVCCEEKLTSVNLKGCGNLKWVDLHDNMIETMDIEGCNNISELHIYNNKLLPSKIKFAKQFPDKFVFGYQEVTGGVMNASVCERNDEVYLMIDLRHEMYCISSDFFYWTCWDENINIEYNVPSNGIYYVKLDYIQKLTTPITVDMKTLNWKVPETDQENERCVNYTFNIVTGTIIIDTYPQITNAMANIWWVQNGKYIFIDTAVKTSESDFFSNPLPTGNYIIQVIADGYLSTFYSDENDSPDISWNDEKVTRVSPGDDITVVLEKNPELTDEQIIISGALVKKEQEKSSLKASARVLQRSTVKLHSSSTTAIKTTGGDWILVATTQTDEFGAYSFGNLPRGYYRITVEIPGYYDSEPIYVQANSPGMIIGNQNFIVDEEDRTVTAITGQMIISSCLSNDEIQLSVYPNPVTDMLRIEGLEGAYTVRIINMKGQAVQSIMGTSPELTLHLNELTSGMYLFRIESQGSVRTLKIIKN